jgi:hypothetical protein
VFQEPYAMTHFLKNMVGVLACTCCAGCSSTMDSSVQGTVTIDGQLADRGTVAFNPVHGGAPAYGIIAKDGSYSLRIGQGNLSNEDASRIHSGDYVVTVVVNSPSRNGETMGEAGPPMPGPRLTAKEYASAATSPLHTTVKPGPNILPLEVKGATASDEQNTSGVEPSANSSEAHKSEPAQSGESAEGAKP